MKNLLIEVQTIQQRIKNGENCKDKGILCDVIYILIILFRIEFYVLSKFS